MSIWDEAEQEIVVEQQQKQTSVWDEAEQEILAGEQEGSIVKQTLGSWARGGMRIGQAVLEIPKHVAGLALMVGGETRESPAVQRVLQEVAEKKKIDPLYKTFGDKYKDIVEQHKRGAESILKAHPEWESEPPENFLDLLTSPRKLWLAVNESMPLLVGAGLTTAAGRPDVAMAMMYAAEGQEAHDQAIIDKATPEQAEQAYHLYGSVAAAIEMFLRIKPAIKLGKAAYGRVINRTAQKVAKQGTRALKKEILWPLIQETIEEPLQGAWQDITAKIVYGKEFGPIGEIVDRRAQEALISFAMALIPGMGGATIAQSRNLIQGTSQQAQITPEEATESIVEAVQQIDLNAPAEEQQEELTEAVLNEIEKRQVQKIGLEDVTDQTSLERVGNAIAQFLGVEGTFEWVYSTRPIKRRMGSLKGNKITINSKHPMHQGANGQKEMKDTIIEELGHSVKKPYRPEVTELPPGAKISKSEITSDAYEVTVGKEVWHFQAASKVEAEQKWIDWKNSYGRRKIHYPELQQWISDSMKQLFKEPAKVAPTSPVAEIQKPGEKFKGPAYRADTGFTQKGTAADVVNFERDELGNEQDFAHLTSEKMAELEKRPAKDIVWVGKTKEDVAKYGMEHIEDEPTPEQIETIPEDVTEIVEGGEIIAEDGDGGYLVLKPETKPVSKIEKLPRKITRKKALVLGHKLPGMLGMTEAERRTYMERVTGKTSMKDMSLAEMQKYVGQLEQDVRKAGLIVAPPVEQCVEAIRSGNKKEIKEGIKGLDKTGFKAFLQNIKGKFTHFMDGLYRIERMCEVLDGYTEGPNYRNIFIPVTQANTTALEAKRTRIENAVSKFWEIMGNKEDVMALVVKEQEHISDAAEGNPSIDLAPMQRIAVYIYAQNKDGLNHLRHGNLADFKNPDLAIKQIVESMSNKEKAIGDWILGDMHKQFTRVRQAVILALGRDITEQDNYFSLYLKDVDPESQTDFLQDLLKQAGEKVAVPEPGEIKARKKGARQSLRLDAFENYFYHVNRIEQFIHLAPIAKSVGDIINNKDYQRELNAATDGHGGKMFKDWLRHSIKGYAAENSSFLGKIALALRKNGIVYSIGYNIPSWLRQQISGFNAMAVHPAVSYYATQHWGEGKSPRYYRKLENRAFEKSEMMRNRNFDRIEVVINRQNPARRRILRKKPWSSKAMSWIRWQDRHTTIYSWNAFYDAALKSGACQQTFGLDGSEQAAVAFADKWVGRTQPMGGVEHLPDFFRGGVIERLLTTFQNQVNNNLNFWYHDIYQARKYGKIDNKLLAYRMMMSYVLPAMALGMVARGGLPRTWKDVPIDLGAYILGPLFFLGRIIYNAVHGFAGAGGGVERIVISEAEKTIAAMIKGDTKGVVKHGIKTVGAGTGRIPAQAIRTTEGVIDLMTDDTDDLRRLIWSEWSLEKGKPKKKKVEGTYAR